VSILRCTTDSAFSLVQIDASAGPTVCSGSALRRWWPQWQDALVLVQPATVARWQRDVFRGVWRRHSCRRPGRPRITSPVRALIRRLASENSLWGAPRIHSELLKLGIAVSERTVSRYLRDRPRAPSQTWPTFFANHLGQLITIPMTRSSDAPYVEDGAGVLPVRQTTSPEDARFTAQCRAVSH
jgi:hypothetical protein